MDGTPINRIVPMILSRSFHHNMHDFSGSPSLFRPQSVGELYFVRAKSEEVHLRADPAYREYAAWIEEHGVFAPLTRMRRRLLAPPRPTVAEPG